MGGEKGQITPRGSRRRQRLEQESPRPLSPLPPHREKRRNARRIRKWAGEKKGPIKKGRLQQLFSQGADRLDRLLNGKIDLLFRRKSS